jgi:hypothetical protein
VNPTAFMADLRQGDNPIYTMADARRACRSAPRRPRNLLPNFAVPGYFNN